MEQQKTCDQRVNDHREERINDIRQLLKSYRKGEEYHEELGSLWEYGLCFDYVAADTFKDQEQGYFRWQISYGGPSEEFRFYCDAEMQCYKIEFWFLDWFDGASRTLYDSDKDLLMEIFDDLDSMGSVQAEFEKATETA